MSKHPDNGPVDAPGILSRRARLHGLLFAGAAFGTALLTFGVPAGKIPHYQGE